MYSTHNEGKPAVAEGFVRALNIWLQHEKMYW